MSPVARAPLRRPAPPVMVPLVQGPWRGMRDSLDPSAARKDLALRIQNAYPADHFGGGLWGRPGFEAVGSQLGTGSGRVGQRGYQFEKLDNTKYTVDFAGGKFYVYDWAADTHTEKALGGALVLDTSAKIYCVTFADYLIFTDGVHKPIAGSVTGSGTGTWTATEITNCPVLFGKPTIYYAKLAGILDADRNTFCWSEENDPFNGYGTAPYTNNIWELGQTAQGALYALEGTNDELIYLRARGTGSIYGEMDDNFRSTGVLDSYSDTIGTRSPDGVVLAGSNLWVWDADGHPQVLVLGSGYRGAGDGNDPVWYNCRETTRRILTDNLEECTATEYSPANLILLGFRDYVDLRPATILVFDATTMQFAGVWNGFEFHTLDIAEDNDGKIRLRHIDEDGHVHSWGYPQEGLLLSDQIGADAKKAIDHVIEGSPAGYDGSIEKHFSQIDYSVRITSQLANVEVSFYTPTRNATGVDLTVNDGGWTLWEEGEWEVDEWPPDSVEKRLPYGMDVDARWLVPRIRHSGVDEEFGLLTITIWAHVIGPSHRVP